MICLGLQENLTKNGLNWSQPIGCSGRMSILEEFIGGEGLWECGGVRSTLLAIALLGCAYTYNLSLQSLHSPQYTLLVSYNTPVASFSAHTCHRLPSQYTLLVSYDTPTASFSPYTNQRLPSQYTLLVSYDTPDTSFSPYTRHHHNTRCLFPTSHQIPASVPTPTTITIHIACVL